MQIDDTEKRTVKMTKTGNFAEKPDIVKENEFQTRYSAFGTVRDECGKIREIVHIMALT